VHLGVGLAVSLCGGCAPIAERAIGTWDSIGCENIARTGGVSIHQQRHIVLTSSGYDWQVVYFDDVACTDETLTLDIQGTWSVGSEQPGLGGAFAADFDIAHVNVTPWNATLAAYVMMMNCGTSDWNATMVQETTSTGCLGIPPTTMCPTMRTLIEVNGDQMLLGAPMGNGDVACDPSQRPTTLDTNALRRDG
jgi:hypothetical protein